MIVIIEESLPSKDINKWPAIILAVKRTDRDPGRIKFLIVSIITINGIKIPGVPFGNKCENIWLVFLYHPNIINASQIGNANAIDVIKCDVVVKIYGNNPAILLIKINEKIDIIINIVPLNFINDNISLYRVLINKLYIILYLFNLIQNFIGIKNINNIILIQFIDSIPVDGSNTENKFVIIISLFFLFFLKLFFFLLKNYWNK